MRQSEEKRLRNASYKSQVKTAVKKFLQAAEEMSPDAAKLLSEATSLIQKGVTKGILHKNTASRTVSRLSRHLQPTAS